VTGLVEQFAAQAGWPIARTNVVVEGTSDVAFLARTSELHAEARGRPILDSDFAVVAAGRGDDGGVEGVNRRVQLMRQLADVDRDEAGSLRHRFVGLLDGDAAGRSALVVACRFDRRIEAYVDLFLLRPVMPTFGVGVDRSIAVTTANLPVGQLDWEIEDLCSQEMLSRFERENPGAVVSKIKRGGFVHHEFQRAAKPKLCQMFVGSATLADAAGMLALLRTMRAYLGLEHEFIGP
jgi:hypothetical protein